MLKTDDIHLFKSSMEELQEKKIALSTTTYLDMLENVTAEMQYVQIWNQMVGAGVKPLVSTINLVTPAMVHWGDMVQFLTEVKEILGGDLEDFNSRRLWSRPISLHKEAIIFNILKSEGIRMNEIMIDRMLSAVITSFSDPKSIHDLYLRADQAGITIDPGKYYSTVLLRFSYEDDVPAVTQSLQDILEHIMHTRIKLDEYALTFAAGLDMEMSPPSYMWLLKSLSFTEAKISQKMIYTFIARSLEDDLFEHVLHSLQKDHGLTPTTHDILSAMRYLLARDNWNGVNRALIYLSQNDLLEVDTLRDLGAAFRSFGSKALPFEAFKEDYEEFVATMAMVHRYRSNNEWDGFIQYLKKKHPPKGMISTILSRFRVRLGVKMPAYKD
eukprot:TRINITY_DN10026_c0_g2_i2.p1 TRINITY_DN10026_c0_g2~~TRINITY_DN10026_c0_g2_i2.p1  ORF type:complete len:384 (+),score=103.45 TRINITY_DN10026_c0_g2_i2:397-1548(+)